MALRIGRGHQHFDVAADDCVLGIAEQLFARGVEQADIAHRIDDNDPVDCGIDYSAKPRVVLGNADGERRLGIGWLSRLRKIGY